MSDARPPRHAPVAPPPRRTPLLLQAQGLAAALPPLLVAAERVAATISQGVHGRRRIGTGEAFWQFRRYESGDAAVSIDWRQSAKSDHAFIRQREWEAAQSVWLWRDASPSMDYRSAPSRQTKRQTAELLLLALAAMLARGGERVALLGDRGPPASGRAVLERLAALLTRDAVHTPSLPAVEPLPRDARLVLFGDFLSPLDEIQRLLAAFRRRGLSGHLVQVFDPAEEALPFSGRVLFAGPEGEGEVLFGRAESIRSPYQEALAAHRRGLRALAEGCGWTLLLHHSDRPPQPTLLTLYRTLSEMAGR